MILALAIVGIVTSVHDGDTFRIGRQPIRLVGIEANEMSGGCHLRRCPAMPASQARDTLSAMVLGKRVRCEPAGRSYSRVTAWCSVGGVSVNCAMIRAGAAVRWAGYDRKGRLRGCGRG